MRQIYRLFISVALVFVFLLFSSDSYADCSYEETNATANNFGMCLESTGSCVTWLNNMKVDCASGSTSVCSASLLFQNATSPDTSTSCSAYAASIISVMPCSLTGTAPPTTITYGTGVTPSKTAIPVYGQSSCQVNISTASAICSPSVSPLPAGTTCTYSGGTYQTVNGTPGGTPDAPTTGSQLPNSQPGTNGQPPASQADCPAGSGFGQINNQTGCFPPGTTVSHTNTVSNAAGGTTLSTTSTTVGGGTSNFSTFTPAGGGSSTTVNSTNSGNPLAPAGSGGNGSNVTVDNSPLTFDSSAITTSGNNGGVGFINPASFAVTAYIPGDAQGGCPFTDKSVAILHTTVTLPFSQWCGFTSWMYPLVSGLAYVGGFFILTSI
jgi:hypothetical protein